MKTLHLVRHAKSNWDNALVEDMDRPLNDRGRLNIGELAMLLKHEKARIDLLLTSPARRAFATANAIAEALELDDKRFQTEPRLYMPDLESILDVISQTEKTFTNLMIVGHEPSLSTLIGYYIPNFNAKVVTASHTKLSFQCNSWDQVSANNLKSAFHRNRHDWMGGSLI
jgi:phosphohistidine phosphatase